MYMPVVVKCATLTVASLSLAGNGEYSRGARRTALMYSTVLFEKLTMFTCLLSTAGTAF
jgi:hypothetical protein